MNKQYKSMKDIAAELGTSKQRVYRCIKKHCIKEAHSEVINGNNVLMYDNAAFSRISELLGGSNSSTSSETHETHHETVNDTLYEALLKQLEAKDQQIEKLQQALDQAQKLHALDKQKILELEDKSKVAVEPEPKKSWWKFW